MNYFLYIFIVLMYGHAMIAQTNTNHNTIPPSTQNPTSGVSTPLIVTTKFNNEYPNTNALWHEDGENFSAEYRDAQNSMGRIIVYDTYGNLVRKEMELDKTSYPDNINLYYKENYPTENYKVWSMEDAKGNLSYYSIRQSGTLLFDKSGNFLTTRPHSKVNYRHD